MNQTIHFIFIIAFSCLFVVNANAKAERSSICVPREPRIDYIQAIIIAKEALVKYLPVEESFIDLVELTCKNQEHLWTIGFRKKAYESGHLIIYVHMDGTTKISVVKDG